MAHLAARKTRTSSAARAIVKARGTASGGRGGAGSSHKTPSAHSPSGRSPATRSPSRKGKGTRNNNDVHVVSDSSGSADGGRSWPTGSWVRFSALLTPIEWHPLSSLTPTGLAEAVLVAACQLPVEETDDDVRNMVTQAALKLGLRGYVMSCGQYSAAHIAEFLCNKFPPMMKEMYLPCVAGGIVKVHAQAAAAAERHADTQSLPPVIRVRPPPRGRPAVNDADPVDVNAVSSTGRRGGTHTSTEPVGEDAIAGGAAADDTSVRAPPSAGPAAVMQPAGAGVFGRPVVFGELGGSPVATGSLPVAALPVQRLNSNLCGGRAARAPVTAPVPSGARVGATPMYGQTPDHSLAYGGLGPGVNVRRVGDFSQPMQPVSGGGPAAACLQVSGVAVSAVPAAASAFEVVAAPAAFCDGTPGGPTPAAACVQVSGAAVSAVPAAAPAFEVVATPAACYDRTPGGLTPGTALEPRSQV